MLFRLFVCLFFQTTTHAIAKNSSYGIVGGPKQKIFVQVAQTTNILYLLSCQNIDPLSETFAPGMRVTEMNYCPRAVGLERPGREARNFQVGVSNQAFTPRKKDILRP